MINTFITLNNHALQFNKDQRRHSDAAADGLHDAVEDSGMSERSVVIL